MSLYKTQYEYFKSICRQLGIQPLRDKNKIDEKPITISSMPSLTQELQIFTVKKQKCAYCKKKELSDKDWIDERAVFINRELYCIDCINKGKLYNSEDILSYQILAFLGRNIYGDEYLLAQDGKNNFCVLCRLSQEKYENLEVMWEQKFERGRKAIGKVVNGVIIPGPLENFRGKWYYTMPYHPVVTLKRVLKEKRLSIKQTLGILYWLSIVLSNLHSEYVIHLDVTPRNILCRANGGFFLTGFYLMRDIRRPDEKNVADLTTKTSAIYTAPEVYIKRNYRPELKADVWSWGAIALVLLGRLDTLLQLENKNFVDVEGELPEETPCNLIEILRLVFEKNNKDRISSEELVKKMSNISFSPLI